MIKDLTILFILVVVLLAAPTPGPSALSSSAEPLINWYIKQGSQLNTILLWKNKKLEDTIRHLWKGLAENIGYSRGVLISHLQEYESYRAL